MKVTKVVFLCKMAEKICRCDHIYLNGKGNSESLIGQEHLDTCQPNICIRISLQKVRNWSVHKYGLSKFYVYKNYRMSFLGLKGNMYTFMGNNSVIFNFAYLAAKSVLYK